MLRITGLSGDPVTMVPVEKVTDVRSLKQHLHQRHGCPPRFRQRLFLHGKTLEDSVELESSMDLDLVLLSFADVSQAQADDLAAAAKQGRLAEVRCA